MRWLRHRVEFSVYYLVLSPFLAASGFFFLPDLGRGYSWKAAKEACSAHGLDLCMSQALCRQPHPSDAFVAFHFATNSNVNVTFDSDAWVAVRDAQNGWLQLGPSDVRRCQRHDALGYGFPEWGGDELDHPWKGPVLCCQHEAAGHTCAIESLGNRHCDAACNAQVHAWDGGDCCHLHAGDCRDPNSTFAWWLAVPSPRELHAISTRVLGWETPLVDPTVVVRDAAKFRRVPAELIAWSEAEQRTLFTELTGASMSRRFTESEFASLRHANFPRADLFVYWAMLMRYQPRLIIEIGSGVTTTVAYLTMQRYCAYSDDTRPCRIHCIEPNPQRQLLDLLRESSSKAGPGGESSDVTLTLDSRRLQDVGTETFALLEAGDFLFIDSSHVVAPYSDVVLEYIFILPQLAAGTVVHIHDIFLPLDYPLHWTATGVRPFTEQWLVGAFLHANTQWKVLLGVSFLRLSCLELFLRLPWCSTLTLEALKEAVAHNPEQHELVDGASLWILKKTCAGHEHCATRVAPLVTPSMHTIKGAR